MVRGQEAGGFGEFDQFVNHFGSDATRDETKKFNASFLYLLREQFSKLFTKPIEAPGSFGRIDLGDKLLVDIANSEYRRRMTKEERRKEGPDETREKVQPLIALSRPWTRSETTREVSSDKQRFSFDGWQVARFLKQIKDGKGDSHE